MGIKTTISDGGGSGIEACVTEEKALLTTNTAVPPRDQNNNVRIFRQHLTDDGSSAGVSDMRVDGSVNNVDFFIEAPADADRYVDTISIVIADQNAQLNQFGNLTALANGVEVLYQDSTLGDVVIADSLKSNFEFVRLCGTGASPVGNTTSSYRASNVEGNSEGYIMSLDFSEVFGIPWGIRLQKNSTLKLIVRVKDNTLGVDSFNMIAYGFDRIIK